MNDNKKPRKCLYSGEEFIPKKNSQRFSTPQNRIKYNNAKASKINLERAFIDKPLHKNHLILLELTNNNKELVLHEEFLLGRGYNFKLASHYDMWEGKSWTCLYEFIIMKTPNNPNIKIIRNDRS